ncbi:cytochrome P450 [Hygrophoropsis aurantiaca]|uniref:Cytochrome P450 n=1 Tax=Hygrophoropsis aurantiaca TaxID=72124 RepID=A0ACB8ABV8_9AGAM|nr:cytochrome P450 [Hygrophoropsis aurantiaca]
MESYIVLIAFLSAVLLLDYVWNRKGKTSLPLPPGPTPLPLLGNLLSIQRDAPWRTYKEWSMVYGDIIYTRVLSQGAIVINSEKVARALLETRSSNYSDRPRFATIELFGIQFRTVLLAYGDRWRLHRRMYHQAFRADAAVRYRPMQLQKGRQLALDLLSDPKGHNIDMHLQNHSASIIMSAVYDYNTESRNDPLVAIVRGAMEMVIVASTPEKAAILDAYPILTRLPPWFPGATFRRQALNCRKYITDMVEKPFEHVKKNMAAGIAGPCMVSDSLKKVEGDDYDGPFAQAIKHSSATAFSAASETTYSTLLVFIQQMVLNPHVQERAQAEIDSTVNSGRLPDFSDRPLLPYVEAVLRETLRYYPVAPLGIAHASVDSDVYEGYYIPKGVTIMVNQWGISRDESKYPNPSEFKPERFITPSGGLNDDTAMFGFGWGRRICPGRFVADASLWSAIATMLAVLNFSKAEDAEGKNINFEPKWTAGVASRPVKFPCRIRPRRPDLDSEGLARLLELSAAQ